MFNAKVATKKGHGAPCTITGNTPIPINAVASWSIKVHKTRNAGEGIYVGVAPMRVNKNASDNHKKCGWYLCCHDTTLWSGPPHEYCGKKYGQTEEECEGYVRAGDSVGVVMDTVKGKLSFVLGSKCLDAGYEEIPLDLPLVPCAIISLEGDSVELSITELESKVITL